MKIMTFVLPIGVLIEECIRKTWS